MAVHPNGTGTGWEEAIDADQPHGKDYIAHNDIRIGVRKRMAKEHESFAAVTAGGEHLPGGCNILHRQDASGTVADLSSKSGDATGYHAGGLACLTGFDATSCSFWFYDDATSPTPILITPGSLCLGADYTWDGAHLFDASCDFSDVAVTGDLTLAGKFIVDSSADFSDAYVDGDISVKGSLKVATDFSLTGDVGVDGTSNFFDEADFSDVVVSGSCCLGSTVADTTGYVTLPGGIVLQWGKDLTFGANQNRELTFPLTFPNAIWSIVATEGDHTNAASIVNLINYHDVSLEGFDILHAGDVTNSISWFAIGN